jgi:hypothetical protein
MANRFSTGKMMNTGKMMKAVSGQHFSQLNTLGLPKQHSSPYIKLLATTTYLKNGFDSFLASG